MSRKLLRAGALSCALLATTALSGVFASPAAAQNGVTPSPRPAPDSNGVDVITGEINMPLRSVSIGRPGQSGLTYVNGFSDGVRQDSFVLEMTGGGNQSVVNIHGRVVTFTINGSGTYVPDDADGSTLAAWGDDFVYTARDGTRIEFLNDYGDDFVGARGSRIVRPDGEVLTYHYKVAPQPPCPTEDPCIHPGGNGSIRVQSVTSNLGFQLKAQYSANVYDGEGDYLAWNELTKVIAINNAVDFCQPSADTCAAFSQAWPTLTLSETESSGIRTGTITDNLSNTVTVTSTADGPTSVVSPASSAADVSITYDSSGRVATIVRGGGTWGYSYSDSGNQRTTTVTQPLGGSRVYVSDVVNRRVLFETDELSRTTSYLYDSNGRLTRTTTPEGNYVQRTYDARGNVTETRAVAKSGSGLADIVTSASFAATCTNQKTCNQPTSTTDARGNTTDLTYDSNHGGLLTATAPAATTGGVRPQVRMSYSSMSAYYKNYLGNIVQAVSPVYRLTATSACRTGSSCANMADEVKSTIAYGSIVVANNLLPTATSSGDGAGTLTATTAQTYDAFGNVLTVDGPLAGTADAMRYRYDALRRPVGTVSPDPDGAGPLKHRAQRLTYNADGNVTKAESGTVDSQTDSGWAAFAPLQAVETSYDTLGRPTTQRLTSGSTIYALSQTSYDLRGRPLCTAQRMNPAEYASLPASACDFDTAGAFGPDRIAKAIYDNANQVTQIRTAFGTADEAAEVTATYRSNGGQETVTDGEGNTTTYVYDGHDRLSQTRYPSPTTDGVSSTTDYEESTYDAGGNVTSLRLRDGQTVGATYDALGRLTSRNMPGSDPDLTYAYNLVSQMTSASQPGHALTFTYDALGRRLTEQGPNGTVTSAYDVAGRRTRVTHDDGFYVAYDYLVTGEMLSVRENGATSGVGVLASYGYDDHGRRTSLTRGNGASVSYSFDPVSRIQSLTDNPAGTTHDQTVGFTHNPAAQIASVTRSNDLFAWTGHANGSLATPVNGLNQVTDVNTASATHDARGNMTTDGLRTYGYNSANLMTSASAPSSGGGAAATLGYDPMQRLHQVTSGTGTARFGHDGAAMIAERDAAGTITRRWVHGAGVDEPIVEYEGSGTGTRRFLHADERGSIVAHSDGTGAVTQVNRYDEYGVPQGTNAGRFGYTGQLWLPEIGLHYYRARMYNPRLGRFMQADPIGYDDGMNMYAYVRGDPVNSADPSGLKVSCTGTRIAQNSCADVPFLSCSGDCTNFLSPAEQAQAGSGGPMAPAGRGSRGTQATYPRERGGTVTVNTNPPPGSRYPVPGNYIINNRNPAVGQGDGLFGACRGAGCARSHTGVDIHAPIGAPVIAYRDGHVTGASDRGNYGLTVTINHGNGVLSVSAHLSHVAVSQGDFVSAGQRIGYVGISGNVPQGALSHLHFEIRVGGSPANPLTLLPPPPELWE